MASNDIGVGVVDKPDRVSVNLTEDQAEKLEWLRTEVLRQPNYANALRLLIEDRYREEKERVKGGK